MFGRQSMWTFPERTSLRITSCRPLKIPKIVLHDRSIIEIACAKQIEVHPVIITRMSQTSRKLEFTTQTLIREHN